MLFLLAHGAPPSCIQVNLIPVTYYVVLVQNIIQEIPSVKHICDMPTVLKLVMKALAGIEVENSKKIKQLHPNETLKRQTQIINVVLTIFNKNDKLKTIYFSGNIIGADGTAAELSQQRIM